MRINYKTKKTISQIVSIVLLFALGVTGVFGISALSNKLKDDKKVIHPYFGVGGLDSNGAYEDTNNSIYTKESFLCEGLEVELDFDSAIMYSVYYYDKYDNYLSSQTDLTKSQKLTVPTRGYYARIVITPMWKSGDKEEDRVCHWYDTTKYSSQLTIKVDNDQDPDGKNLFKHDPTNEGKNVSAVSSNGQMTTKDATNPKTAYTVIEVTGMAGVKFVFDQPNTSSYSYHIFNGSGNQIENGTLPTGVSEFVIEIPAGGVKLAFNYGYEKLNFAVYENY